MRLLNVGTLKLETFADDQIPPYAILSHTWGREHEEISFADIQNRNIDKSGSGSIKLKGCCSQAKADNLQYVWIDTCCINKDSSKELDEAINSMFQWYRKAAICYSYLSDVPCGDDSWRRGSKFYFSLWFQRGWTLQELLAPGELRFYNQSWALIGTKKDMSQVIQTITGIYRQYLLGWVDVYRASVAQRMSWAARRKTSRKEDMAYCLLGIFDISMPMIYGEGERAFGRLQQEIMKTTGDRSMFAWGLESMERTTSESIDVVSAGMLAITPSEFINCRKIVPTKQDTLTTSSFEISGGRLRISLPLYTAPSGEMYGLLNCGPEENTDQVVGIPIRKAIMPGSAPDEYLRPQGHCPVLLSRAGLSRISILTERIQIQMGRQSTACKATGRRFWVHIDGHQELQLKQEEEYPLLHWHQGRGLIAEASDPDAHIMRRYLVRFRTPAGSSHSPHVIVVLELQIRGEYSRARCYLMESSMAIPLDDLSQKLIYMRPEVIWRRFGSRLAVTVEEEKVVQDPIYILRLAQAAWVTGSEWPPPTFLDPQWSPMRVDSEFQMVNRKLAFIKNEEQEKRNERDAETLAHAKEEEAMSLIKHHVMVLERLQEESGRLIQQLALLLSEVKKRPEQIDRLKNSDKMAEYHLEASSRLISLIRRDLDWVDSKQGPGNWSERTMEIKRLLEMAKTGDLCFDRLHEESRSTNDQTPPAWTTSELFSRFEEPKVSHRPIESASCTNSDYVPAPAEASMRRQQE